MLPQELLDVIQTVDQQAPTEADLQGETSTRYLAAGDPISPARQFNDGEDWGITEDQVDEGLKALNERLQHADREMGC